jgi:hypothetical protein
LAVITLTFAIVVIGREQEKRDTERYPMSHNQTSPIQLISVIATMKHSHAETVGIARSIGCRQHQPGESGDSRNFIAGQMTVAVRIVFDDFVFSVGDYCYGCRIGSPNFLRFMTGSTRSGRMLRVQMTFISF